ncbi:MAG: tetratricopeptide repeat protein [Acidobacteria bacterium]|nr:tetratricopeptide repeat protein [Acidobacteriota bacterium]
MTVRVIAIVIAVLLQLSTLSLDAQITPQALTNPSPQTKLRLTKALDEYRAKGDLAGESSTLLQLGIVEASLGNLDEARSGLVEAAEKMRSQNDLLGAWMAHLLLCQVEAGSGRVGEAIRHAEKAVALLDEVKASTAPINLKTLTAFSSPVGFSPQMLKDLDGPTASVMKPILLQSSLEPLTHDMYGNVLALGGKFEKAEKELQAAAAGSAFSRGLYDFSIEGHFGDLRFLQKNYDEARAHYMKALNASPKMAMFAAVSPQIKAGIYERLARLETITNHPEEAKRWSEKAQELGRNRPESR